MALHLCAFCKMFLSVLLTLYIVLVTLLFFLGGLVTASLFFKLAMDWPIVIQQWSKVDNEMNSYGFPKNLRRKLRTYTITIMAAAISKLLKVKALNIELDANTVLNFPILCNILPLSTFSYKRRMKFLKNK